MRWEVQIMKSKRSCFNKTIFFKNITLYWPLWGVYFLYLLNYLPFRLYLSYRSILDTTGELSQEEIFHVMDGSLNVGWNMIIVFLMAIVSGMVLYNYLFVAKSANMIHAFPVTRGELFGTNLISGLAFLMVPQVAAFLCAVLVCLSFHVTCVQYLGLWLLVMLGISFLAYSMVVFCVMMTGQMLALPFYVILMNFLYLLLRFLVYVVVVFIGYGFSGDWGQERAGWLSPMYYLMKRVYITKTYTTVGRESYCSGYVLHGGNIVLGYAVFAVVLLVIAYFCYQKRQLEQAGELLIFWGGKVLFRCGSGMVCGYFLSMLVIDILQSYGIVCGNAVFLILLLVFGWLFYLFAEMLLEKSFHVFGRTVLKRSGIFLAALLISFGAVYLGSYLIERKIPAMDEIRCVTVEQDGSVMLREEEDAEKIQEIVELHKEILKYRKEFHQPHTDWYHSFSVTYTKKDGSRMERYYELPECEHAKSILDRLYQMAIEPDSFLTGILGKGYEEPDYFTEGYFYDVFLNDIQEYAPEELDASMREVLLQAIIADAKDGVLQKYNIPYVEGDWAYPDGQYGNYLELEHIMDGDGGVTDYWEEPVSYYISDTTYAMTAYVTIYFGKDCSHILSALEETGLIESREDLLLETDYEKADIYSY